MEETNVLREEYENALKTIQLYESQNKEDFKETDFGKKLDYIESITDSEEKLNELNHLCQDVANEFSWQMSHIESMIENTIDEAPIEVLNNLGWYSVSDVTQDISVKSSWEW